MIIAENNKINRKEELELGYCMMLRSLASQVAKSGWDNEICQSMEIVIQEIRELLSDLDNEEKYNAAAYELVPRLLDILVKIGQENKNGSL